MKSAIVLALATIFIFLPTPKRGGEIGVKLSVIPEKKTLPAVSLPAQATVDITYANLIGNDYDPGQCVWFVATQLRVPAGMGNAIDWYNNAARDGVPEGDKPKVGAVAWSNSYWLGHVAEVIAVSGDQIEVEEMNYQGPFITDTRWTPASDWRYIYPA